MDSSFNPHTHAGCDHGRAGGGVLPGMVSIHTPPQGVTISAQAFNKAAIVSIHTPTQGVTGRAIRLHPNKTVSIHTPTQGVTNGIFAFMGRRDVSIHTPTQGVTVQKGMYQPVPGFNPHTHAGCDFDQLGMQSVPALFQSTHPRRV